MGDFIQFIHPGREHGQDAVGRKGWNAASEHRRKFIRVEGSYVEQLGQRPVREEVVLWGEWEPESEVERIAQPVDRGPRWLHTPYYVKPNEYTRDGQVLQNTDPFVFGDRFLYTLCRQWRVSTWTPTMLRDLAPGSLILFGSLQAGEFVLDTVFVTDEGVRHDFHSWPAVLAGRLPDTYADVTMLPTYEWGEGAELRLYSGATPQEPRNGMYSFAPCSPADAGSRGFARPAIRLDGFVTPGLMMGFKASRGLSTEQVSHLWESVAAPKERALAASPAGKVAAAAAKPARTRTNVQALGAQGREPRVSTANRNRGQTPPREPRIGGSRRHLTAPVDGALTGSIA